MKNIIVLMLSFFVFSSCYNESDINILFKSELVEINEATTVSGLAVTKIYTRVLNGVAVKDSIRVNLVGAQRANPVNVTFEIDAASTALAGIHYNLTTTGNSVQIPANSSFAFIYFQVLDDNIAPSTSTVNLKFNLTGGDLTPSKLYSTFTRRIRTN
jgi:hypothetical protein